MKYLRILVCLVFVVSVCLYKGTEYIQAQRIDNTYPVIMAEDEVLLVSCDATEKQLLKGLRAEDGKDGDITDKIMVDNISTFVEKGVSNIQYVVFDEDCNFTTYSRKVIFDGYESPRFHLSSPLLYTELESAVIREYITATDSIEGDITNSIKFSIEDSGAGKEQVLRVEVANSYGDMTSLSLNITLVEAERLAPVIELKEYLVYVKEGEDFDAKKYIKSVDGYGEEPLTKQDVVVIGQVDTSKPGVYEVNYEVTEEEGKGQTRLVVIVE